MSGSGGETWVPLEKAETWVPAEKGQIHQTMLCCVICDAVYLVLLVKHFFLSDNIGILIELR